MGCIVETQRKKEGNGLFNDILFTIIYGVGHVVRNHSDSEREEILCHHMGYFSDEQQGFFYMRNPTDRIAHTTVSRGVLAETGNSSMGPP